MARTKQARVAIYARVSTKDKEQTPQNQLRELRRYCQEMDYKIVGEYVDRETGRSGTDKRRQFAKLFTDAAQRRFELVLLWSLDRFSREGMMNTVVYLKRLDTYGIDFRSYTEPHVSTEDETTRNVVIALLSSLAKVESEKISRRTKAGLERARAEGKRLGRPPVTEKQKTRILQLYDNGIGKPLRAISRDTAVGYGTVHRICKNR